MKPSDPMSRYLHREPIRSAEALEAIAGARFLRTRGKQFLRCWWRFRLAAGVGRETCRSAEQGLHDANAKRPGQLVGADHRA